MYGLSRNIIFCYIIELRKCVHVLAPSSDTDNVYEALLDVSGVQRLSGYKFSDSSILSLLSSWHDTTITFVQTDKPIYKPGQKGKLNISTLYTYYVMYELLFAVQYDVQLSKISTLIWYYGWLYSLHSTWVTVSLRLFCSTAIRLNGVISIFITF